MNVGKHIMWILAIKQSSNILQSFMASLEEVRFDGHGSLPNLEKSHGETRHEHFVKFFTSIPELFFGAAIANPQCNLKSIEIDAGDSQRASGLLAGVELAVSVGYKK